MRNDPGHLPETAVTERQPADQPKASQARVSDLSLVAREVKTQRRTVEDEIEAGFDNMPV